MILHIHYFILTCESQKLLILKYLEPSVWVRDKSAMLIRFLKGIETLGTQILPCVTKKTGIQKRCEMMGLCRKCKELLISLYSFFPQTVLFMIFLFITTAMFLHCLSSTLSVFEQKQNILTVFPSTVLAVFNTLLTVHIMSFVCFVIECLDSQIEDVEVIHPHPRANFFLY